MSKELRSKIIALHETGSSNRKISKRLKDESINTKLIYRTIKRMMIRAACVTDLKFGVRGLQGHQHCRVQCQEILKIKVLVRRFAPGSENQILFSDEKLFTVEEATNTQNDRILARCSGDIPEAIKYIDRVQKPMSVMVWGGECPPNHGQV